MSAPNLAYYVRLRSFPQACPRTSLALSLGSPQLSLEKNETLVGGFDLFGWLWGVWNFSYLSMLRAAGQCCGCIWSCVRVIGSFCFVSAMAPKDGSRRNRIKGLTPAQRAELEAMFATAPGILADKEVNWQALAEGLKCGAYKDKAVVPSYTAGAKQIRRFFKHLQEVEEQRKEEEKKAANLVGDPLAAKKLEEEGTAAGASAKKLEPVEEVVASDTDGPDSGPDEDVQADPVADQVADGIKRINVGPLKLGVNYPLEVHLEVFKCQGENK